jgi:hypothetical protein
MIQLAVGQLNRHGAFDNRSDSILSNDLVKKVWICGSVDSSQLAISLIPVNVKKSFTPLSEFSHD